MCASFHASLVCSGSTGTHKLHASAIRPATHKCVNQRSKACSSSKPKNTARKKPTASMRGRGSMKRLTCTPSPPNRARPPSRPTARCKGGWRARRCSPRSRPQGGARTEDYQVTRREAPICCPTNLKSVLPRCLRPEAWFRERQQACLPTPPSGEVQFGVNKAVEVPRRKMCLKLRK